MVDIDWVWLPFWVVAYSAPIGLGASLLLTRGSGIDRSFSAIFVCTSILGLAVGFCTWLDGATNRPFVLPTIYLGMAIAWALVTAVCCGRLMGLLEAERRDTGGSQSAN
jgi:hypothetical protein